MMGPWCYILMLLGIAYTLFCVSCVRTDLMA